MQAKARRIQQDRVQEARETQQLHAVREDLFRLQIAAAFIDRGMMKIDGRSQPASRH